MSSNIEPSMSKFASVAHAIGISKQELLLEKLIDCCILSGHLFLQISVFSSCNEHLALVFLC